MEIVIRAKNDPFYFDLNQKSKYYPGKRPFEVQVSQKFVNFNKIVSVFFDKRPENLGNFHKRIINFLAFLYSQLFEEKFHNYVRIWFAVNVIGIKNFEYLSKQ